MKFKKSFKRKQIAKSQKQLSSEYYWWKAKGSPYHDYSMETALNGCIGCKFPNCEDGCPIYSLYPAWRMPDGVILWSGGDGVTEISELIEVE